MDDAVCDNALFLYFPSLVSSFGCGVGKQLQRSRRPRQSWHACLVFDISRSYKKLLHHVERFDTYNKNQNRVIGSGSVLKFHTPEPGSCRESKIVKKKNPESSMTNKPKHFQNHYKTTVVCYL